MFTPHTKAKSVSPNIRSLQEAYKTFEHAGYRLKDLKGSNTAVYVADNETDYYLLATEATPTMSLETIGSSV